VGGKADRELLVAIRDKVAALKREGKPLPEVVAAKPGGGRTINGSYRRRGLFMFQQGGQRRWRHQGESDAALGHTST
jgi:hypothetical protein